MRFFEKSTRGTHREDERRYLIAACILTALAPYEFWGTKHSGSITLLGDAFHVVADGLASWMSFWAAWSARQARTLAKKRIWRARGTLINGLLLLLTAPVVLTLGMARILTGTHQMDPHEALEVIAVGIVANLIVYFFVYGKSEHADELRESARWHALSDALTSLVALASAWLVANTKLTMWDPLLSLATAGVLAWKGGEFVQKARAMFLQERAQAEEVPPKIS